MEFQKTSFTLCSELLRSFFIGFSNFSMICSTLLFMPFTPFSSHLCAFSVTLGITNWKRFCNYTCRFFFCRSCLPTFFNSDWEYRNCKNKSLLFYISINKIIENKFVRCIASKLEMQLFMEGKMTGYYYSTAIFLA